MRFALGLLLLLPQDRPAAELAKELQAEQRRTIGDRDLARVEALRRELIDRGSAAREAVEALPRDDDTGWYRANILAAIGLAEKLAKGEGDLGRTLVDYWCAREGLGFEFWPRDEIAAGQISAALAGLRVFQKHYGFSRCLYAADEKARKAFALRSFDDLRAHLRPCTTAETAKSASVQLANLLGCLKGTDLTSWDVAQATSEAADGGFKVALKGDVRFKDDAGEHLETDEWSFVFDKSGACQSMTPVRRHEHFKAEK